MPGQEKAAPHPPDALAKRRRVALARLAPVPAAYPAGDERYTHSKGRSREDDKDGANVQGQVILAQVGRAALQLGHDGSDQDQIWGCKYNASSAEVKERDSMGAGQYYRLDGNGTVCQRA